MLVTASKATFSTKLASREGQDEKLGCITTKLIRRGPERFGDA